MFKNKPIEPKCKNCRLFDEKNKLCGVVILHDGNRIHLPVDPDDDCFFENEFTAIDEKGEEDRFKPEVQQVKWWVEDPETGEKAKEGIVKIEYPEGFFGEEKE